MMSTDTYNLWGFFFNSEADIKGNLNSIINFHYILCSMECNKWQHITEVVSERVCFRKRLFQTDAISDRFKKSENASIFGVRWFSTVWLITQCQRNDDWSRLFTGFVESFLFSFHVYVLCRMSKCHVLLIESFKRIPRKEIWWYIQNRVLNIC